MTQVLSSPPSLSLPAFATFSLDEPLLSPSHTHTSTTSSKAGDRDAQSASAGAQPPSNNSSGGVRSSPTGPSPPSASTAMSSSAASAAHMDGSWGHDGGKTPPSGATRTAEGTPAYDHPATNGHKQSDSSSTSSLGDRAALHMHNKTATGTASAESTSTRADARAASTKAQLQQQLKVQGLPTSRSPSPMAGTPSSASNSAFSSRSGTPVNGGTQHRSHHQYQAHYTSNPSSRSPSPSPSNAYTGVPSSAASSSPHHGGAGGPPNMAPSQSPPHHHPQHPSMYLNDANSAAMQTAMMQAAYQQQQQHLQNQMNAMLAAGYSQHQLMQHFQQHQQHPYIAPPIIGNYHDPRRRAPSLPNSPNGGGLINNAGYFPAASRSQQQHHHHHYQSQPQTSFQQAYYHPQFAQQQQYPQSSPHAHHPHYSPYPSPPPIPPAMRSSPVSSANGSPGRERAPTAPSSLYSPMSSATTSPSSGSNGRSAPDPVLPPFAHPPRPASPGGVADLARRRAESQPNDQRVPLAPTTATQSQVATSRSGRVDSASPAYRKPVPTSSQQSPHSRPSQLHRKGSADFASPPLPRIRTESGDSSTSSSSNASAPQNADVRAASPASATSDRAPTPTQALHSQLAGSSTSIRSGRTTPTTASSSTPATQQQTLGLQPSIMLANSTSPANAFHHSTGGAGIIRKASPLSQQSTCSDGHRSVTPTQALASEIPDGQTTRHNTGEESEEASERQQPKDYVPISHRATLSNASSALSNSPQTPSSGKSGSSFLRNKLRKAMSLSELNNSSSTLSSGDASSSSKHLGRTSLTSNSSSSDTSHSTAEPRTPPNGLPPAMLRDSALASASRTHAVKGIPGDHSIQQQEQHKNGRAASGNGGSLPSNAGRRFGILNSKMNSSTDNISISSTVSSASMMLRKMGNFGKLARKSSVRSLSNLFHRDKYDKEDNEGEGDSIGPNARRATSDAVSEFGVPGAAMVSSKDRKKASLADPSVAHVTVELERGEADYAGKAGMTPAEALVRKHQERERLQKLQHEKDAIARARTASASSSVVDDSIDNSTKSKSQQQDSSSSRSKLLEKEKERLKNQNAGKKSLTKKFSFGAFSKAASTSSLRQEALYASDNGSNQQATGGKVSPRSSSSSSSANASPIFDSSATSSSSASPVILQHEVDTKPLDIDFRPSLDGVQLDTWRNGPAAIKGISMHPLTSGLGGQQQEANDEGFDDRTPRQSMELIGDQSLTSEASNNTANYSDWDGEPPTTTSYFDDDTASFRDESDHTARSNISTKHPFYLQQDPADYSSDSGVDGNGRNGQAIPKRPPPHARPSKGILKNTRSYNQEQLHRPQPAFASRPRASSHDAPQQMTSPNQPGKVATLAQYIPTGNELDGVAAHPSGAPRLDTRVSSPSEIDNGKQHLSPTSSSSFSPGTSPYHHPNTSEPILSNMKSVHMAARSVTGPIVKRNISFAQNLSVHTTWSGSTYDRRGDTATCNRLTPELAQAIKEELNSFKMEEMAVHHLSRNYTHFFV